AEDGIRAKLVTGVQTCALPILSDLALIKTIKLPTNDGPNEPRLLPDGRTVLVNTGACHLYQVTGLAGMEPALSLVHSEPVGGCRSEERRVGNAGLNLIALFAFG